MTRKGPHMHQHHPIDPRKKKWITASILVLVLILSLLICQYIGRPLIRTVSNPQEFRDWIRDKGMWAQTVMVGLVMLQIVLSFIPGEPFELGAGYAFGAWEGMALCLIGSVLASVLIFVLVRKYGMKLLTIFFEEEKIRSLPIFHKRHQLEWLVFILFLIPGVPKDLVTYAVGLTDLPLHMFLILSTVARIPSVLSSTLTGSYLGEASYKYAIIVYSVTAVLTAIGIIVYRRKFPSEKKNEQKESSSKDV